MVSYSLKMHSYNVYDKSGLLIARHTGYNLVIIDDNGKATIQGIDFAADNSNPTKAHISITESAAEIFTFPNQEYPHLTQEAYWTTGTTQQQIDKYQFYNSNELASGRAALEAFNKIKLDAALSNIANQIDYDYIGDSRVCNTATQYWGQQYIPGFNTDIYDSLPNGTLAGYYGKKDDYVNSTGYQQAQKIGFINQLVESLAKIEAIDDALSSTEPYISDKYLQLLEPLLANDFHCLYDPREFIEDFLKRIYEVQPIGIAILPMLDIISKIKDLFGTAEGARSPLVVDLDGDGVETVSAAGGIYFDHDANGFKENSGWVGQDDGILVRDINGNGQIDNGTELFGNNSVLSSGEKAVNGFEALKELDDNNDGTFDANDKAWNEVKIWQDKNFNGMVDDGELLTLEQAGIAGIDLDYTNQENIDENGNNHKQTGTFIKTDGTTGAIDDVWFDTNPEDAIPPMLQIEFPDDIRHWIGIIGIGNVYDFRTAMALDKSGKLQRLVEQFQTETDIDARNALLPEIIYRWAGVYDMDPEGRNPSRIYGNVLGDCRKLEALEEFLGKEFLGTWCSGERDPNPHGRAAPYILQAFDLLQDYVKACLLLEGNYKKYANGIILMYDIESGVWSANAKQAVSLLADLYREDAGQCRLVIGELSAALRYLDNFELIVTAFKQAAEALYEEGFEEDLGQYFGYNVDGSSGNDVIYGTDAEENMNGRGGNDKIYAGGGNDTVLGGEGDDYLYGEDGNDFLHGGNDDDFLIGGDGDDILTGGTGNDYLAGGNGADLYLFNKGFGHDTVDNIDADAAGTAPDIIRFGEDISVQNVKLKRQGFDLIITVGYDDGSEEDTVRILSYFDQQGTTSTVVDRIEFADGTVWDYDYIADHWDSAPGEDGGETIDGNENDNSLKGTGGNDILLGYDGEDSLFGEEGNDWIEGGRGDDDLYGGAGNDTYFWGLGDGLDTIYDNENNDTIIFGEGVFANEIKFRCVKNDDLQIMVGGNSKQGILIKDFFYGTARLYKTLQFADGSKIRLSDKGFELWQTDEKEKIIAGGFNDIIHAGGGNDEIRAGHGNDTLIGGKGNDILYGGEGDDIYVWNKGDGLDEIWEEAGLDTIRFGEGIAFSELTFTYDDGALLITVDGDDNQGLKIWNFFGSQKDKYMIEKLAFADGSSFNLSENGLVLTQKDTDDQVKGTAFDDTIYGNGGDDTLHGKGGNDILCGGKGNDTLNGGEGDDIYLYKLGDGFDIIYDLQGNDKISFGEGITLDNLSFTKDEDNLKIIVNNDEGQGLLIKSHDSNGKIEELTFADGSRIATDAAQQLIQAMNSFGADTSSTTDALSNPTENVSDMYALAASQDLTRKAI